MRRNIRGVSQRCLSEEDSFQAVSRHHEKKNEYISIWILYHFDVLKAKRKSQGHVLLSLPQHVPGTVYSSKSLWMFLATLPSRPRIRSEQNVQHSLSLTEIRNRSASRIASAPPGTSTTRRPIKT